jgi:hypothetical protein
VPLRRSVRLTKKAASRLSAVVVAQYILMRKLGIASSSSIQTEDFNCCVQAFAEGLSIEQENLIDELFMASTPTLDLVDEEAV